MYRRAKPIHLLCKGCDNEITDLEDIILVPSNDNDIDRTDLWHSTCAKTAGIKVNTAVIKRK